MKQVTIYTDGSSHGNPGPGGWGAVLQFTDSKGVLHEKELSGGEPETTNNRMELSAPIAALERLKSPCEVMIISDSKYVVDAFQKDWITNWQKNGWKTAAKKPVKNVDLWEKLLEAMKPHRVSFVWVKGHNETEGNERCDRLANEAADRFTAEDAEG